MNSSLTWQEVKYEEIFEQELRGLERRRINDASCTVNDLERVLENLYIMEGAEWSSDVQDIIMAATIAAYELYIAQWKVEMEDRTGGGYGMARKSHTG